MQLATLRSKYRALAPVFTERSRRVWAATEAQAIGHGGIALVERATGISRSTIQRGCRELESGETLAPERTRKAGAGRVPPQPTRLCWRIWMRWWSPRRRVIPSRRSAGRARASGCCPVALEALGHEISHTVVAELLHELGYSLQGNAKTQEGTQTRIATGSSATSPGR